MNSKWCGAMAFLAAMSASPMGLAQAGGMGGAAMGGMGDGNIGGAGGASEGGGDMGGASANGGTGGQAEGGGNGVGVPLVDADGDGYPANVDCDDTDSRVYPNAPITCPDGPNLVQDQNCDGYDDGCEGYYQDGGGSVPLANLVGTALFGLWLGRSAWKR